MLLAAFYFVVGIAALAAIVKFGQHIVASTKHFNGFGDGKR